MNPRIFVDRPLSEPDWAEGLAFELPPAAARHVQVLRLQPGSGLTLFDGRGGQWAAQVSAMTRSGASVVLGAHQVVERELPLAVTLAVCMPANDRMDDLVEKATELGASGIVPLMSERSVLRLSGERAAKRQAHWQAVAVAAAEQSGRNRVPVVHAVQTLEDGLTARFQRLIPEVRFRWQLSLEPQAMGLPSAVRLLNTGFSGAASAHLLVLSGPEGGLSAAEQAQAQAAGFTPVSLGPRTLRADTAPLAALAVLGALAAAAGAPNS